MKIGITGATGFIGPKIIAVAQQQGHALIAFSRNTDRKVPGCEETRKFSLNAKMDVSGCDAIIHLAGEPVFGWWTADKKRRIRESRTLGTRHVVDAILASPNPPRMLVSTSAIGFYGDTGEVEATEDSPAGSGFLSEVTQSWEIEALRSREKGVRVVLPRISVVLGHGGALKTMMPAFRLGLGGKLGSGKQWMSWIHVEDMAALMLHAATHDQIEGPINAVAPAPCRNEEFTKILAGVLHRPAFFQVPAFALKLVLGEFSGEMLDSKRIVSNRIAATGFQYRFPGLEEAIANIVSDWNCPA